MIKYREDTACLEPCIELVTSRDRVHCPLVAVGRSPVFPHLSKEGSGDSPALVSFHRILWNTGAPCLADAANLVQPLVSEGTWSRQPAMGLSASTRDTASGGFMRANGFVAFPILLSHILRWPEYSLHHGSQHIFPELSILNFWLSNFSHLSWWDPGGRHGVFSTVNVPLCLGFMGLCSFESCC